MDALALSIDSGGTKDDSASSAFAAYPDANATKLELTAWFKKFQADLIHAGFGCLLRKEPPRETKR